MPSPTAVRYEDDVYTWTIEQAAALRRAARVRVTLPEPIDFENVAEEIESLGVSQLRELYSRYRVLLMHLLKWQYEPERQGPSWRITIRNQRDEIARLLQMSPGLKPKRRAQMLDAYAGARADAADATGLDPTMFPVTCPWTLEQVERPAFRPGEG
jgi:hypothetical protein